VIAVGAVAAAILVTRLSWPLFSKTPFAPLFVAAFLTARFSTEIAGLVAIVIAAFGARLMVPAAGPSPFQEQTLMAFVGVCFVMNRVVAGRNRAEAALRSSEAQFRAAWENAVFGAALLDARGLVERINPAMERALGFASTAWSGVSFTHFALPEEAKEQRARFAAFMNGEGDWYEREQRFRRADGSLVWCRVTMSAIRHGDSKPDGALMVIEDVTRRRHAEEAFRASETRYRALVDDVPVGLVQIAPDGRILMANRALLRMLGRDSTEAIRDTRMVDLIATPEGQTALEQALRAGRNLQLLLAPLACRNALRMVTIDTRAVRGSSGAIEHYDATIVDAPKGSVAVPTTGM
jgi:PAS domain S-box-containing protein